MENLPHYFIAIPLPDLLKEYFSKWQNDLKERVAYKQWPHQQDLHITLKFLGPVEHSVLQQLQTELKEIEQNESFEVKVGTIGTFGNPQQPRVLWAGVEKTEDLAALQREVEECAIRAGFAKENREYRPHITLAKKWVSTKSVGALAEIRNEYTEKQSMGVEEVVLYQIFLGRTPKYEIIQSYSLQKMLEN